MLIFCNLGCWGACFAKAGITSEASLCGNTEVSNCICDTCDKADDESYKAWLASYCSSSSSVSASAVASSSGWAAYSGSSAGAQSASSSGIGYYGGSASSGYATGTISYSASASATPTPGCWEKCFGQAGITAESQLCGNTQVDACIQATCSASEDKAYWSWYESYCGATGYSTTVVSQTSTYTLGYGSATTVYTTTLESTSTIYNTEVSIVHYYYVVPANVLQTVYATNPAGGAYGAGSSAAAGTAPAYGGNSGTKTYTVEATSTLVNVVTVYPVGPSGAAGYPTGAESCGPVPTVTVTETDVITVTIGGGSGAGGWPTGPGGGVPTGPGGPGGYYPSSASAAYYSGSTGFLTYPKPSGTAVSPSSTAYPSCWSQV